jgi:hypothetical protein
MELTRNPANAIFLLTDVSETPHESEYKVERLRERVIAPSGLDAAGRGYHSGNFGAVGQIIKRRYSDMWDDTRSHDHELREARFAKFVWCTRSPTWAARSSLCGAIPALVAGSFGRRRGRR